MISVQQQAEDNEKASEVKSFLILFACILKKHLDYILENESL